MIYAQLSDIEARYPARDLIAVTDPNNLAIQAAPINLALADAAAEIDGYIGARYALPIIDTTPRLTALCCDIAMYRLQALRPLHDLEDARKRYEDALKFLTMVAKGTAEIGITADTNAEPPQATDAVVEVGPRAIPESGRRMFTRRTLRDF